MKVKRKQARLMIEGLELWGFHGVLEDERRKGGRFCIDLELDVDLQTALETDRVEDSVDYRRVVEIAREVNRSHRYSLIEVFADAIAEAILANFQRVHKISVRVAKLNPPGVGRAQRVAAGVVRERI